MVDGEKRLGIKSWSEEDRPREKLLIKGKEALSNAELFAILLGSGTKKLTAVDVAKNLLSDHSNNINLISQLSVKELCNYAGIGEAKAVTIVAAAELGRRRKADKLVLEPINTSGAAYEFIYPHLADLDHERFFVILLSRSNKPIRAVQISSGGASATVVDSKMLFKRVFEFETASSIILAHNHPSGNLKPSSHDKVLTEKLVSAGKTLDMQVLDHLIIGHHSYYSFADEGIMPR